MTWQERAKELAEEHVDWYLKSIRPILIDFSVHFFKHGMKENQPSIQQTIDPDLIERISSQ